MKKIVLLIVTAAKKIISENNSDYVIKTALCFFILAAVFYDLHVSGHEKLADMVDDCYKNGSVVKLISCFIETIIVSFFCLSYLLYISFIDAFFTFSKIVCSERAHVYAWELMLFASLAISIAYFYTTDEKQKENYKLFSIIGISSSISLAFGYLLGKEITRKTSGEAPEKTSLQNTNLSEMTVKLPTSTTKPKPSNTSNTQSTKRSARAERSANKIGDKTRNNQKQQAAKAQRPINGKSE